MLYWFRGSSDSVFLFRNFWITNLTVMSMSESVPFRKIIEEARFAPSGDNIQPWRLEFDGEHDMLVYRNQPKELSEYPPYFITGTYFGIGAFIEHIVIAARQFGFETEVFYNDHFDEYDDFISRIHFRKSDCESDPENALLFNAFRKRVTNRFPFLRSSMSLSIKKNFSEIIERAGGNIVWLEGGDMLRKTGYALSLHDDFYWEHKSLHDNLVKTVHSTRVANRLKTGMPIETLGLGFSGYFLKSVFLLAKKVPWFWKMVAWQSKRKTRQLALHSAAFGFVCLPKKLDQRVYESGWNGMDHVVGGRIAARLWLLATASGIGFQPAYAFVAMTMNEGNAVFGDQFLIANRLMMRFLHEQVPLIDKETLVFAFRIGYRKKGEVPMSPRKTVDMILS